MLVTAARSRSATPSWPATPGAVRALNDYRGERLTEAHPGDPIEILGFDTPPHAGDSCAWLETERVARQLASSATAAPPRAARAAPARRGVSLEKLFSLIQEGQVQDLNIVLKGDVQGSVEALVGELAKFHNREVRRQRHPPGRRRHHRVGHHARLRLGRDGRRLQRAAERRGRALAEREGVEIRTYRVIYQLTEEIEQALCRPARR